jgi:hypothetical protein
MTARGRFSKLSPNKSVETFSQPEGRPSTSDHGENTSSLLFEEFADGLHFNNFFIFLNLRYKLLPNIIRKNRPHVEMFRIKRGFVFIALKKYSLDFAILGIKLLLSVIYT